MRKLLSLLIVCLLSTVIVFAQKKAVTGIVNDNSGSPVPFATVTEVGSRNAVTADANGIFNINLRNPSSKLSISGTGFTGITITPSTGNNTITLQTAVGELKEVTVSTALGTRRQAKSLGYSSSIVSGKDIENAKPISLQNGLTGKVSGLQVNTVNNGLLAPTRITLRGNRSLTGNNQPLLVVDGAIFYNDLNTLNPDDIADVTILKGASAAAIYGSDASNGAIIVTTKKGTRGKPTLTFTSTTQIERVAYLPKQQTRFGNNGGEFFVDDFNDLSTYVPYENQSYGPEYNGRIVPLGRPLADGSLQKIPYSYLPNEKRNFFNTGVTTQNNINFQGGDENQRFYLSLQDLSTTSIMPGDKGRRDIARVGGSRIYGKFNANYNLSYTYLTKDVTNTQAVYEGLLNVQNNVPITHYKDWKNDKFSDLNGYYNDYADNPYWIIGNDRNKNTDNNLTANIQLGFQVAKWVNLSYRLGLTNLESNFVGNYGAKTYSAFARNDNRIVYANYDASKFDTVLEGGKFSAANDVQASSSQAKFSNQLITSDFTANFDRNISSDFNLKATLGTAYQGNRISNIGFNVPGLFFPVYNVGTRTSNDEPFQSFAEARKFGAFGEATVGFRNYAFIHGSYRGDIDSRLSKSNRFIPYYDVDAALTLTDLFKGIQNKVLTTAKIRAAYSVTGNASALGAGSQYIAAGAYRTLPTFDKVSGFPFTPAGSVGSIGGFGVNGTAANPDIKPETVTEKEVGLELNLFQGRVGVVAAYYNTKLTNGIVFAQVSRVTGISNVLLNAANTQNKGYEIELKLVPVKTKNVTWNINTNYSHNDNKVLSIQGQLQELGLAGANGNAFAIIGHSFPSLKSRDWNRDAEGHVIVNAVTGNPSRDANLKYLGDANAKDIIGISTGLTFKSFTFNVTGDYRGGHKIFNSIGQYIDFVGIGSTTAETGRQRFVFPNSVTIVNGKSVPNNNITVDDANFNFWPGLYRSVGANYIISAAAWKIREVSLGYNLPRNLIRHVSNINITLSARNLFMFRPKTNVWTDPEFSEDTSNAVGRNSTSQLPPSRIYGATVAVTF